MRKITDFHVHVWPDAIAERTCRALGKEAGLDPHGDGTAADLIRSMKEAGITLSVILPVITRISQFDSITAFASQINEERQGLLSFGAVFPGDPDYRQRLKILKDYGFKGIKLHPDYHDVALDDRASMDLIYEASSLGMAVSVHAGVDIGLPERKRSTPYMALRVMEEVRPSKLILAHTGGWKAWDRVEELLAGRDVYFDLSFTDGYIRDEQWIRIIKAHGAHRCLFGSDHPWSSQKDSVAAVSRLGLSEAELEMIYHENAERILEE